MHRLALSSLRSSRVSLIYLAASLDAHALSMHRNTPGSSLRTCLNTLSKSPDEYYAKHISRRLYCDYANFVPPTLVRTSYGWRVPQVKITARTNRAECVVLVSDDKEVNIKSPVSHSGMFRWLLLPVTLSLSLSLSVCLSPPPLSTHLSFTNYFIVREITLSVSVNGNLVQKFILFGAPQAHVRIIYTKRKKMH